MAEKAVMDVLNDFVTGALVNPAPKAITPKIAALLDHARLHEELTGALFGRQSPHIDAGKGRNT